MHLPNEKDQTFVLANVWHPLTRAWHWSLAVSVIAGWILGEYRSFSLMQWHFYCGYMTGGLLLFRLYWGFKGPSEARFSTLLRSIRKLPEYAKNITDRKPSGTKGHNPLGSISVFLMLITLVVQVCTGLFAEDDGLFYEGPLHDLVSEAVSRKLNALHHQSARAILILVGLHLSAIAFYWIWKKENLVSAMFTGKKRVKR